jgi:hypothetical protein
VRRQDDLDGRVQHAEVRLGEAVLMVASNDADYDRPRLLGRSTGQGIYLLADDVDRHHARAVDAGGTMVFEPEDTEWAPGEHASSTPKASNVASVMPLSSSAARARSKMSSRVRITRGGYCDSLPVWFG